MGSNTWREELFFSITILLVGLSAGQNLPDLSQCGQGVGCLRNPTNCTSLDNCTSVLRWYKSNDSNYIGFDLMAVSDGWVAVGFSMDMLMGNDSAVGCVRNTSDNGNVKVGLSYNPGTWNQPYITNSTIQYLNGNNGSYVNGRIICSFQRSINGDGSWIFPLNNSYYLFLAFGPTNAAGDVSMHQVFPRISPVMVNVVADFPDLSNPVTTSAPTQPPPSSADPSVSTPTPGSMIYISDQSGSQVTFTAMPGTNQVRINMTGIMTGSSGWLGLGFSNDQIMADDSVIDCILKNDGTMVVKHSYNKRMNNVEIPNANEGISNANLSSTNGLLQCVFQRQINGLTNPQIYSLDKPYYIMIAHGPVDSLGMKQHHDFHFVTPQVKTVASSSSAPMGKSYFSDNDGDVATFKYLSNTSEIAFQITGPVNGSGRWIALGFSSDNQMGNDSVLDCILLKNGTIIVQHSFNEDNPMRNYALNSSEGITVTGTSYENGYLNCSLKCNATGFTDRRIFSLDQPFYMLLAKGPVSDDGIKLQHEKMPTVSSTAVDMRSWSGNVTMQPDQGPTTVSPPSNASTPSLSSFRDPVAGNMVQFTLAANGTYVEFTIQRPSPPGGSGWVAVGFSDRPNMVNSSVIDCILTSNGTFKVQLSYNEPVGAVNDELGNPDSAIIDIMTENKDGIMKCNLKRKVSGFSDNRIFPFTAMYHLLLASGPLQINGMKDYHSNKVASPNTFNLTSSDSQTSSASGRRYSNAPDPIRLLRAHAVLMLTTFVMLMSGAIILARYYKTCWPENKLCGTGVWFAVHRFMMVLGLFCCAAGFIIIFCYSDGYLYRSFASGSPSYYWVHGPLGIVVMILIIINPIMAIFRCDPDHNLRWIYNWLHFTVGMCCQILAGITLFFGIKMGEQYYNLQHWSVFWILIAFVSFHVFIEFILIIEKLVAQRFTKQTFTISYGMSGPGEEASAVKTGTGIASQESLMFRYCALTLYTTVTMALWLAMIILIGGGFWV